MLKIFFVSFFAGGIILLSGCSSGDNELAVIDQLEKSEVNKEQEINKEEKQEKNQVESLEEKNANDLDRPTVDEDIQIIANSFSQFDEKRLTLILLNQYENPLNLGNAWCSNDRGSCVPVLYDELGEQISGMFYNLTTRSLRPSSDYGWDDDAYVYHFSEQIPDGTYTVRFKMLKNGQIGPARHWEFERDYGRSVIENDFRYTVARYYKSPVEQTFSVSNTKNDLIVKLYGEQTDIAYQYWAVCAKFKNVLGTELEDGYKSILKSSEKNIFVYRSDVAQNEVPVDSFSVEGRGLCIATRKREITKLLPGKYEWHVKRDGYKSLIVPFELQNVSEWSDDEVRIKSAGLIDLGEMVLEKE